MIKKFITTCIGLIIGLVLFGIGLIAIAVLVTYPKLPSLDAVQHYQPKMPLTVYSADEKVIGVYGEQRRAFTKIEDFPQVLKDAVIAAEDKRFFEHWGVDLTGVARAIIGNPEIILADEPTGNLDSRMGAEVMELLHRLNKEDGRTIVMVTHNEEQAKQTSRTVRFFDGHQVQ